MQLIGLNYAAGLTITPSDTTLISLRGIYVGGAGNVTVNNSQSGGTSITFTAPPVGTLLPIMLEQGRVMATGTTATLLIALQ